MSPVALGATWWLYLAAGRPLYETFSAAVVNTAATLAAATFVGVFDLFFTLQQMRQNRESERRWEELVAQMRQDFQAERERNQAQQEARQQQLAALLTQNLQITALQPELLEWRNGPAAGASGQAGRAEPVAA